MTIKNNMTVRAVVFDMDGVITNTMPDHFNAWRKAMLEEKIIVNHFDIYSREGQRGLTSVQEIFSEHNRPYSRQKAERLLARKEQIFKELALTKTRFISGSRSFLKNLYLQKIRLGLVTGTSRHEFEKVLPPQIASLFEVVVTGCDVKHGKPNPEPYQKAMRQLRLSNSDVVVIENAPFGIRSAKAAGLKCFAIETSLPKRYLKEADRVFASIKDICSNIQFSLNN